ncbi:hypothetical protein CP10139811_0936 [Chlamydia ibidis]|uniref:Uncharacterized protein n=2 Tax=Chlamydia ibidis TaxID=1405396 RepID=S7J593_9CHLA|nr:hypothetical protein CP10139811_0936 [Chlamydia ibidis]EQM63091.1 hypothetical protein H359_0255 [Chlamydia ibidis 10-1398/6]
MSLQKFLSEEPKFSENLKTFLANLMPESCVREIGCDVRYHI